ncbi:MAG TPA: MMPL family transporter, partial [Burkholderiaceae bacterium]|nr:MMPL family transporter [Burkholderiaceae bacterium]
MSYLSDHVTRHWLAVIIAWGALLIGLRVVAPRWDDVTNDGDVAYLPAEMPTLQAERLRAEAFPEQRAKSQIVVVLARSDRRLNDDDLDFAAAVSQRFRQVAEELGALEVWDPDDEVVGRKLVSRNRQAALVVVQLPHEFAAVRNIEVLEQVRSAIAATSEATPPPSGLEVGITGSAAIGGDMLGAAKESIRNTEVTTIALVLLILLAVYRAPLLILIPLATIAVSVSVAMNLVALLTRVDLLPGMDWWNFKIFTTTKIFVVVILFGAGTDFCLFLIARY